MPTENDWLHTFIEHLCGSTEVMIRHLAPKNDGVTMEADIGGMFVVGCIARSVSCLRSISLLCKGSRFTEANMVYRNLVDTHATLVDVMRKDAFYEFEYRSRYEMMKIFNNQVGTLRRMINKADSDADRVLLERNLESVEPAAKRWEIEYHEFGRSLRKKGIWKRNPRMCDVYKVPPVREIFKDTPLYTHLGHDLPSTTAVHPKSVTTWNDLVEVLTGKRWFSDEDMEYLLRNAINSQVALTHDGLHHYRGNQNAVNVREMLVEYVMRDLEEEGYARIRGFVGLVGHLLEAHILDPGTVTTSTDENTG